MSKPMTPAEILGQLKKWQISYKEYKSWKTHNRGDRGDGFNDVKGFMVHHTGSDNFDQRDLLYNGYDSLPGPLCHFGLDRHGVVHLIGWGRANHAGGGDPNVLKSVISENYEGVLKPKYHDGSDGAVDGNARFYGVEIWYSGKKLMSPEQMATLLRLSAAICDFHKWSAKSVIGHGEWSNWKWDPGQANGHMYNMNNIRANIQTVLKNGPKIVPTNPKPRVDPADKKSDIYKQVWDTDAMTPPKGHATIANPTWHPSSVIKYTAESVDLIQKRLDEIREDLKLIKDHLSL